MRTATSHHLEIFSVLSREMVGLGGLEPPTSPLSGVRSNHLSYRPVLFVASRALRVDSTLRGPIRGVYVWWS